MYKIYFTSAYVLITLVIKTYMCPGDLISAKLCRYHKATKYTTQCTFSMLVTIDHYNFMKSNAFVLMLDTSKAFDRVNYCKLFRELLEREMSPLVLRLLLFMYTNQTLRVKWGSVMPESFTVMNGVKQGGVLSPVLFAVYTDGLLLRLQESGIGCHMGGHYAGALAYADDITLISPSMTGLRKMSSICEQYASEYDILFNGSKSKLLFFKGRCCNVSTLGIVVCGQLVEMSDTAVHLGHTITSNDRDNITKSAKSSFWKSFNILIAEFGKMSPFVISKLFNQYCCSFYGSSLWAISGAAVQALCVDWRKALRSMWRLNPRTITALSSQIPLIVSLKKRFAKFINRCLSSHNTTLQFISCVAINNPFSRTGTNYRDLLNWYHGILNSNNVIQSEWSKQLIPLHN